MKTIITSLFFFSLITICNAQVSSTEKEALLDFYYTTNGANWNTQWDLTNPVSQWHGVTVANNAVIKIELLFNNLEGYIPPSISKLKNLEVLEVSFNKLGGKLPVQLGALENLNFLAINGNKLTGEIPSELGAIKNLKELHLSSNNLVGTIPSELGKLDNLKVLNLFDNNLSGTIPYAIADNNELEQLVIAENEIITPNALADVLTFKKEAEELRFKTNTVISPTKTVIATETSDDEN